jgi:hypothetical protein
LVLLLAGASVLLGSLGLQPVSSAADKPVPAPASQEKPEPADNSYCIVCHANYETEKLVAAHQPAGVGCEQCHGKSVKHSGDEDGLTPPDKMFPKSEVTAFCIGCHAKDKLLKREDHEEFFTHPDPGETCGDCHAEKHRLKVRTRIWDKKTRKLLSDDGVRMMQKDSPATEGAARKSK